MLSRRLAYSGEYEKLAGELLGNVGELESRKEYRKAGEMLWGAAVNYGKAILSLLIKNPEEVRVLSHRELRGHIKRLLLQAGAALRLISDAEKLHANFYENFIDKEEYFAYKERAIELISFLSGKLREVRDLFS